MTSRRPVIGISTYEEVVKWNLWEAPAALLPATYVRSITKAGGLPVLIPIQPLSPDDATDLLGRLDGLILAGGPDIDPVRYGEEAHPATDAPRTSRDELEAVLAAAVTEQRLPTLAICRGIQLLNVVRGGTLHQHLPDVVGHDEHRPTTGRYASHVVHVASGTRLADAVGWDSAGVPTHHHQGVATVGDGLVASAWTDDGTVEAIEDPALPFLVGVQWHPEQGEDPSLFTALVEAASRHGGGP